MDMDYHIVFNSDGTYRCDVPWKDDDNAGLPDWFFDENCISFEVTTAEDKVEWAPAMGPAPVWTAKFSEFSAPRIPCGDMWRAFSEWFYATY